jgi:uncharacterized Zn-finger protein
MSENIKKSFEEVQNVVFVEQNVVFVEKLTISCNGSHNESVPHPKVYLTFKKDINALTCPYCETVFAYKPKN